MKPSTARVLAAIGLSAALVTPLFAHHSAAAFDTQKEITVKGTVVEYRFANPHA
jgi:hypothetical protein